MISFNIGQLAFFMAKLHNVKTIYFVGNYVRKNPLGQQQIRWAVDICQGIGLRANESPRVPEVGSRFVSYDGYLGAIGAFMNEFKEAEASTE